MQKITTGSGRLVDKKDNNDGLTDDSNDRDVLGVDNGNVKGNRLGETNDSNKGDIELASLVKKIGNNKGNKLGESRWRQSQQQ